MTELRAHSCRLLGPGQKGHLPPVAARKAYKPSPPDPDINGQTLSFKYEQQCDISWYQNLLIEDLRQARRAAGWSQQQLADRLGLAVLAIKRLEAGKGSVRTLLTVMTALEVRLSGLGPGATLAEQLKTKRIKRGLSLDQLATKAGLARATVLNLEQGGGTIASLTRLLAVLAPNVRRRAPERAHWGAGDKLDRDSRFTPADFMDRIYEAFGEIDLDPCANELSSVRAKRRILPSEGGDGLADAWSGHLAFVNPPYSDQLKWLQRAYDQWTAGNVETAVCLVPVRTDSAWFHEVLSLAADLYLLKGRIRFLDRRGKSQPTPFSLMLVVLGSTAEQRARCDKAIPGFWLPRRSTAS